MENVQGKPYADNWGENIVDKDEPFVLDLSNFMPPEFAVPVAFRDIWCWLFKIC